MLHNRQNLYELYNQINNENLDLKERELKTKMNEKSGDNVAELFEALKCEDLQAFKQKLVKTTLEELSCPLRHENGGTVMHLAAEQGRLDEMLALIQHGMCPFIEDLHKATPLEIGMRNQHREVKCIYVLLGMLYGALNVIEFLWKKLYKIIILKSAISIYYSKFT